MEILKKIKNNLFCFFRKNKFLIFSFTLFFLIFLLMPDFAYAGGEGFFARLGRGLLGGLQSVGGWIAGRGAELWSQIGWFFFTLIFTVIGTIAVLIAQLSIFILLWVLSPDFQQLSYTNPAGNPIIQHGLDITQGFVNIILVLILIYIALATILRLAGYETKKMMVTFVLIALLVNFAPVLAGLIVDASNIIMYTFVEELEGFMAWGNTIGGIWEEISVSRFWDQEEAMMMAFFQSLTVAMFASGVAFITIIYAVVFIFRYIAIWVLVILSPLAFLAYVLPTTRRYFSMWWQQLLQWSFFGAIGGFFLYLSASLIQRILAGDIFILPEIDNGNGVGEETAITAIIPLLPSMVPIVFLFIGLIVGLQTSAIGASAIVNTTQRQVKRAGVGAGRAGYRAGYGATAWTGRKAWERVGQKPTKRAADKLSQATDKMANLSYVKKLPFYSHAMNKATQTLLNYSTKKTQYEKPKNWDKMTAQQKSRYARTLEKDGQIDAASWMAEEGSLTKAGAESFRKDIIGLIEKTAKDPSLKQQIGKVLNVVPDEITKNLKIKFELAEVPKGEQKTKRAELEKEIQGTMSKYNLNEDQAASALHIKKSIGLKDMPKVTGKAMKSDQFQIAMREKSSAYLQWLRNNADKEVLDEVLDGRRGLNKITREDFEEIKRSNPELVRWATTTPAGQSMLAWSDFTDSQQQGQQTSKTPKEKERERRREVIKKRTENKPM